MPQFVGPILGITRVGAGFTGGITGNTTYTLSDVVNKETGRNVAWDNGWFGISVTTIGTQSFSVYVMGLLGGVQVPIAGLSGIATTTTTLIPLVSERTIAVPTGSTSFSTIGIPTPRQIVFGNSATPGQSFSAIIYAALGTIQS